MEINRSSIFFIVNEVKLIQSILKIFSTLHVFKNELMLKGKLLFFILLSSQIHIFLKSLNNIPLTYQCLCIFFFLINL